MITQFKNLEEVKINFSSSDETFLETEVPFDDSVFFSSDLQDIYRLHSYWDRYEWFLKCH
jgi:hypothetical protein